MSGSALGAPAAAAFIAELGLPGLVDVHVHFHPPRLQRRIWDYFDQAGPLIGRDWPITYRAAEPVRLRWLAELGVRHFTALSYAHRPGMAVALNEWTLALARRVPGCVPSATFFPEPGVLEGVRAALDAGARVFKVHLQVSGFDPREPVLDPVWGLLAEAGTAVVVHAGSGPVRNGFTGPGPIGEVLARHPRLRLVIAHLGAPEYADFLALAERFDRVHLDTTMALTDFFESLAPFPRELVGRLGDLGEKVVLGSDFPTIPYSYADQLEALAGLGLGADWLRAVCWHNGLRLLGLSERGADASG